MSYLKNAVGVMKLCPDGVLNSEDSAIPSVVISCFQLQEAPVTVSQYKKFLKEYESQPWARFERKIDDRFHLTHMGRSQESLEAIPVVVIPGAPIAVSCVIKVVPTEEEYERRFNDDEHKKIFLSGDHPVVEVTCFEAMAYASSIGGRLPTSLEFEYASRAGREGSGICGVSDDGILKEDNAHWSGPDYPRTEKSTTLKVKSFKATPWGHYDLAGNIWEWVVCENGLVGGAGGCWDSDDPDCLLANSYGFDSPLNHNSYRGFRVARSLNN